MKIQSIYLFLLPLMIGCGTSKIAIPSEEIAVTKPEMEIRNLDTLVIEAEQPSHADLKQDFIVEPYWPSIARKVDLLHTRLDLSFDWEKESVMGRAALTLTPIFKSIKQVTLDAKGFDITSVHAGEGGTGLQYQYDDLELIVTLERLYTKGEKIHIAIDYTAHPSEGQTSSTAITSDKGLFFINPQGSDKNKPQQIWTQGETDFNSRWFPTLDQPNERCTQEVLLTVEDRFTTLSNGLMTKSTLLDNGKRSDLWVMDQPHAPYLFMIAIGEFAVVKEDWNGKEVSYYVEKEYEEDAKAIFAHTKEMLSFFSDITGLEYPWQKYAQIIVRDYVSGAMENTTAVIFGEPVQKHARELIDNDNDYIVAHEMFHHWFGDYVTCESWSNLTLNEGFANYGEYLWMEHKNGRDYADNHRLEELQGYLFEAAEDPHPLIEFGYEDKEDMFDAHSYNKGGLVLHMLRTYLGDKVFFAGLNTYLFEHAYDAVEVHDLRLAFEDVSGEDLNWFFNQWYLDMGHPIIDFSYDWNAAKGTLYTSIEQVQDPKYNVPVFTIPTQLEIYYKDGSRERSSIKLAARSHEFEFKLEKEPAFVVFDPDRTLLAIIQCRDYSPKNYQDMYTFDNVLALRSEALQVLSSRKDSGSMATVMKSMKDPFWSIRSSAINSINWNKNTAQINLLVDAARKDAHSGVKTSAISALGDLGDAAYQDILAKSINTHDAYPVVGAAIKALHQVNPEMCQNKIEVLAEESQTDIVAALSSIYSETKDTSYLTYFARHIATVDGFPALEFYTNLERILRRASLSTQDNWMDNFSSVVLDPGISPYAKIGIVRTMSTFLRRFDKDKSVAGKERAVSVREKIQQIIKDESNSQLKGIYSSFIGS